MFAPRTRCFWLAGALTGCLGGSDGGSGDSTGDSGSLAAFTAAPGLCGQGDIACAQGESPPELVGAYSGQATITLTTADLWAVGESFTLSVEVTAQRPDLSVDATVRLDDISLDGQGSLVRGEGDTLQPLREVRVSRRRGLRAGHPRGDLGHGDFCRPTRGAGGPGQVGAPAARRDRLRIAGRRPAGGASRAPGPRRPGGLPARPRGRARADDGRRDRRARRRLRLRMRRLRRRLRSGLRLRRRLRARGLTRRRGPAGPIARASRRPRR